MKEKEGEAAEEENLSSREVILDLRSDDEFRCVRLNPLRDDDGVVVAHMPALLLPLPKCSSSSSSSWRKHLSQLPRRTDPLFLLLPAECTTQTEQALREELSSWRVGGVHRDVSSLLAEEPAMEGRLQVVEGEAYPHPDDGTGRRRRRRRRRKGRSGVLSSISSSTSSSSSSFSPSARFRPRLWQPSEVARAALKWMAALEEEGQKDRRRNGGGTLLALDLACGCGRDSVYLAEELRKLRRRQGEADTRWRIVGCDHHHPHAVTCATIAEARGVTDLVSFQKINLKKAQLEDMAKRVEANAGAGARIHLCIMSRFFHRPLMEEVRRLLSRGRGTLGAAFALATFEGIESCLAYGHPKRARDILAEREMDAIVRDWNHRKGREEDEVEAGGGKPEWRVVESKLYPAPDGSGRTIRGFITALTTPQA